MQSHPRATPGPEGVEPQHESLARAARARIVGLADAPLLFASPAPSAEWFERLTAALAGLDGDPTRPVGVLLRSSERDPYLVLAVLASGRGAILISADLPSDACRGALAEASACGLLVDRACAADLGTVVLADDPPRAEAPVWDPDPEQHALLVMTSGTSGSRRLFGRSHAALVLAAAARIEGFGLQSSDRVLSFTALHFTGGMNQLATAIVGAHGLELGRLSDGTRDGAADYLVSLKPSVINGPPTVLRNLLRATEESALPDSMRMFSTSGELVLAEDVRRFYAQAPAGASLVTSYGSTESGTVLIGVLEPGLADCKGPLPLGRPLRGVQVLVVDLEGIPVPDGHAGRILIRSEFRASDQGEGPVAARLRRVEGHGEGLWLDIGDRGLIASDGRLVVCGRDDDEVLYQGVRLRPAAIESALGAVVGVRGVVVGLVDVSEGRALLVAAMEAEGGGVAERVRSAVAKLSPVEQAVRVVDVGRFPLNSVGKADRRLILDSARDVLVRLASESQAPVSSYTRLELLVADLWQELLGVERPARDAVWEMLGGDSMQLLKLAVELEARFGLRLPTELLHGLRTIREQAAYLECGDVLEMEGLIGLAGRAGAPEVVVILAGVGGHAWTFNALAREMGEHAEVIGLTWARGEEVVDAAGHLEALAQEVAEFAAGRRVLPIGFSAGARVAWDLTARWIEMGVRVERVVVLDGPTSRPRSSVRQMLRRALRWARARRQRVERYLEQIERSGRVVLAATGLKRLDVGVVVIQSRGTGELGWEEVAEEVERLRVDREHLELVRAPLPEAVGVCLRGLLA